VRIGGTVGCRHAQAAVSVTRPFTRAVGVFRAAVFGNAAVTLAGIAGWALDAVAYLGDAGADNTRLFRVIYAELVGVCTAIVRVIAAINAAVVRDATSIGGVCQANGETLAVSALARQRWVAFFNTLAIGVAQPTVGAFLVVAIAVVRQTEAVDAIHAIRAMGVESAAVFGNAVAALADEVVRAGVRVGGARDGGAGANGVRFLRVVNALLAVAAAVVMDSAPIEAAAGREAGAAATPGETNTVGWALAGDDRGGRVTLNERDTGAAGRVTKIARGAVVRIGGAGGCRHAQAAVSVTRPVARAVGVFRAAVGGDAAGALASVVGWAAVRVGGARNGDAGANVAGFLRVVNALLAGTAAIVVIAIDTAVLVKAGAAAAIGQAFVLTRAGPIVARNTRRHTLPSPI